MPYQSDWLRPYTTVRLRRSADSERACNLVRQQHVDQQAECDSILAHCCSGYSYSRLYSLLTVTQPGSPSYRCYGEYDTAFHSTSLCSLIAVDAEACSTVSQQGSAVSWCHCNRCACACVRAMNVLLGGCCGPWRQTSERVRHPAALATFVSSSPAAVPGRMPQLPPPQASLWSAALPSPASAPVAAPRGARLESWERLVSRLLCLSTPQHCTALTPLVPIIAAFLLHPGCYGTPALCISFSAVDDEPSQQKLDGRLRLTACTTPSLLSPAPSQQRSAVVLGHYETWAGLVLPTVGDCSISAVTGSVYVQCANTLHVIHSNGSLGPNLRLSAPLVERAASTVFASVQHELLYMRIVQLRDGIEHLLTVDGARVVHVWSMDGLLERSVVGLLPAHPSSEVEAVEVSRRDDSFHVSFSMDDSMRLWGYVTKSDCKGRRVGDYDALTDMGHGPHTLHLLPSPYSPTDTDWLYAVKYGIVTVCDSHTRQRLFCIGGCSLPALMNVGRVILSHDYTDVFIIATRTFAPQQPRQNKPLYGRRQSLGSDSERQERSQPPLFDDEAVSVGALACDTARCELYMYNETSSRWLVCDQRGHLLRWWRERRPARPTAAAVATPARRGACFDPLRQQLLCCQRLRPPSLGPVLPPAQHPHTVGTTITVSV